MNRREFLRRAASLVPAAIVLPPAISYFLPPKGGWKSVDVTFSTADLALSLEEFERRVIQPAIMAMAKKIDRDVTSRLLLASNQQCLNLANLAIPRDALRAA